MWVAQFLSLLFLLVITSTACWRRCWFYFFSVLARRDGVKPVSLRGMRDVLYGGEGVMTVSKEAARKRRCSAVVSIQWVVFKANDLLAELAVYLNSEKELPCKTPLLTAPLHGNTHLERSYSAYPLCLRSAGRSLGWTRWYQLPCPPVAINPPAYVSEPGGRCDDVLLSTYIRHHIWQSRFAFTYRHLKN